MNRISSRNLFAELNFAFPSIPLPVLVEQIIGAVRTVSDILRTAIPRDANACKDFPIDQYPLEHRVLYICSYLSSRDCTAINEFAQTPDADMFCQQNCLKFPSHCPKDKCVCN